MSTMLSDITILDSEKLVANFPFEPTFSRIFVIPATVEFTKGGLYVPEEARHGTLKTNIGLVVAVGSDVGATEPGEYIYYGRYAAADLEVENIKYQIMNEADILGVVREEFLPKPVSKKTLTDALGGDK